MDDKDERILEVLKENSKLTTQQISKRVSIPITTVHNRMKKLEKDGVIKKYTAVLDYKKIGKPISAYVLIIVDYKLLKQIKKTQHDLSKKIKQHPSVEEASRVTGGTDIILKTRVKDVEELDEFVTSYLRNVDGVDKTQTMVILNES